MTQTDQDLMKLLSEKPKRVQVNTHNIRHRAGSYYDSWINEDGSNISLNEMRTLARKAVDAASILEEALMELEEEMKDDNCSHND